MTRQPVKQSLTVPNLSTFELSRMVDAFPLIGEKRMADILIRFLKMRRDDLANRPSPMTATRSPETRP